MRELVLPVACVCWLAVSASAEAQWLLAPQPTAQSASASAQAKPAQEPAAAPAAEPAADTSRSLFEPTWRQFQIGGRFTSVDGDPARFQRYQDIRDGLLFTDAKYAHEAPNGAWLFQATADNLGFRDQRYTANYERPGRFALSGFFDQIPQFYSVDTKTPYTADGGV